MTTILISGSSSGIGRAIAEKLLTQGHHVLGLARQHKKFQPDNPNYNPFTVDFSKLNTLEKELKLIQKQQPDVQSIICCAGYGHFTELEQFSFQQMQDIMNVNFLSQALLIKTFLSNMKKKSNSKIIIMGSECALEGYKKGSLYCASKFALRGFAQSLRKECASAKIAVTLINPGLVETPFFQSLQFKPGNAADNAIRAEQIADTVDLLMQSDNHCVYEEITIQPMNKVIQRT